MNKPTVQDIFRHFYTAYLEKYSPSPEQAKTARNILNCKTGAYGANISVCEDCGHGAFKMAARNNVPVIPIFITMQDSDKIDGEGFPIQEYTVNIAEPIYPDENLSQRENTEIMLNKNFEAWKKIYEDFYGIPLEYTTEVNEENVNVL